MFLCKVDDVPLNGCLRVKRGPDPALAVFNLAGRFHALDDRCSHGAAMLSRGRIDGGSIVCPLHSGSFDIATGAAVDPPCTVAMRHHPLRIDQGAIYLADG